MSTKFVGDYRLIELAGEGSFGKVCAIILRTRWLRSASNRTYSTCWLFYSFELSLFLSRSLSVSYHCTLYLSLRTLSTHDSVFLSVTRTEFGWVHNCAHRLTLFVWTLNLWTCVRCPCFKSFFMCGNLESVSLTGHHYVHMTFSSPLRCTWDS